MHLIMTTLPANASITSSCAVIPVSFFATCQKNITTQSNSPGKIPGKVHESDRGSCQRPATLRGGERSARTHVRRFYASRRQRSPCLSKRCWLKREDGSQVGRRLPDQRGRRCLDKNR